LDAEELDKINQVAISILRKLYFDRKIGGSHTAIENLPKGLPKHMGHYTDKAIKYLFREKLLVQKSTGYGKHVSLNPKQIPKIEGILGIEK
jgi:hypothetical protein